MDGGFNGREQQVRHVTNRQREPVHWRDCQYPVKPVHGSTGPPLGRLQRINGRCELDLRGPCPPGEHVPIVDGALFDEVQTMFASHARLVLSPLAGRIFDDRGNHMTPATANKGGVRYRYYVSCVIAQGRRHEAGIVPRVPAPEIEAAVSKALGDAAPTGPQHSLSDAEPCCENPRERDKEDAFAALHRVIVASDQLDIFLRSGSEHNISPSGEALRIPWRAHVETAA
jgi:hypothetical protein